MFVILFIASAGKALPALNANEKTGIKVGLLVSWSKQEGGRWGSLIRSTGLGAVP